MMTREVKIGNISIGGKNPIAIQSMLNRRSSDIKGNVEQAIELEKCGCQIIRLAVPDMKAMETIRELKKNIKIPVVADIHFDYRLAIAAIDAGIDKVRINPGNIGDMEKVKLVVNKCKENKVPIRIGVNGGSLSKEILKKYGCPSAEAMCECAMEHIRILESLDFFDTVISLKTSDVKTMIDGYRKMRNMCDYPLHLGVTEAGSEKMGIIKSAVGIGSLLADGIGETIRVSLTADPIKEIFAAKDILASVGMLPNRVNIISCPTCGRTKVDLFSLVARVEDALKDCHKNITVAVMGCAVNGPGEASHADIGVAAGDSEGLIFKRGKILRKVPEEEIVSELLKEIENI